MSVNDRQPIKQFNPLETYQTLVCIWRFEHAKDITIHVVQRKHFSTFSTNSEAFASEFLEKCFIVIGISESSNGKSVLTQSTPSKKTCILQLNTICK